MRDSGNADFNGVVVNEFTYTAKYWPIKMMQRWNNYCDLALKEIEKTKALNDGTYNAAGANLRKMFFISTPILSTTIQTFRIDFHVSC